MTSLRTPRSALRRRTTAASAALLLGLALTACGGGDDTEASDEPSSRAAESTTSSAPAEPTSEATVETSTDAPAGDVPSEADLAAVLIGPADLPAGFEVVPDDGEDDDDSFDDTCLADIGEFSDALGFEPDTEAEVDLGAGDQSGQTFVTAQVEAYADPTPVGPAFSSFTDTLQQCTSVDATDDDGVAYALDIAYDDSVDLPGAEDQLRVQMTGTISSGAESYDVTYRFVVAFTGRFISVVGAYAVAQDATGVLDGIDDLATVQAERVGDLG